MAIIRFTETASKHIDELSEWWAERRRAAQPLEFLIAKALETISRQPELPSVYLIEEGVEVRRLRVRTTLYHVYYSSDRETREARGNYPRDLERAARQGLRARLSRLSVDGEMPRPSSCAVSPRR